ncbi:monovalent cation/H(+) antiporter subunit G [Thermococcus thioreducens]|uniref:Cation:proton antiporter n=1 Tax=Thermococcus thioreducens TaxID=277988 RepID=A0A0Q2XKZ8_9EURY|nr:monovalent cation/H(+) antiporter subunit G [Thermococcus thioreducens]ASJ13431.1 cation:proton antiporter [Thermococcus thioreducens]KQH81788.1 cation:proton antiporter [Thermococcus thioreducens]SEW24420.1 multicomponent Na+:H+ antiporter subunit G [Thermococcus thioreducens]
MIEWLIGTFLVVGVFFNLLASVGILRFPDVYTRIHAATKCTTFGTIFIVLATVTYSIYNYWIQRDPAWVTIGIHSALVVIFLVLTNPVGAHALGRAARKSGIRPYGAVIDELEGRL